MCFVMPIAPASESEAVFAQGLQLGARCKYVATEVSSRSYLELAWLGRLLPLHCRPAVQAEVAETVYYPTPRTTPRSLLEEQTPFDHPVHAREPP